MKKLLIILMLLFAVSCEHFDSSRSLEVLQSIYPDAQVMPLPDSNYRYVVIDSCGKILYVRMLGKYDEVTSTNILKHCNKHY